MQYDMSSNFFIDWRFRKKQTQMLKFPVIGRMHQRAGQTKAGNNWVEIISIIVVIIVAVIV